MQLAREMHVKYKRLAQRKNSVVRYRKNNNERINSKVSSYFIFCFQPAVFIFFSRYLYSVAIYGLTGRDDASNIPILAEVRNKLSLNARVRTLASPNFIKMYCCQWR
jgi:hypothetical protein